MNKTKKHLQRKAFTLIELLIVIAIIGILFIVLVSKVDFATDKAKATGVQTDFRSFQVAIESVARENAGLATFGWDTGDTNGNRIRDSYDKGDTNQNGIQDDGEVFVGSKTYGETWTNVYTLANPADADDKSAIVALETAINANLDPKLHINIADDLTITMANGAQDPWKTEYHGYYITNATVDNKDRGAIVIYSNGANQEFGSEHSITGGVVTVNVPGNNVYGKDDYGMSVVYTYVNGYGEVKTTTSGFSVNQGGGQAGTDGTFIPGNGGTGGEPGETPGGEGGGNGNLSDPSLPAPKNDLNDYTWKEIEQFASANLSTSTLSNTYHIDVGDIKTDGGYDFYLVDVDGSLYYGFSFMFNSGKEISWNDTNTNAGGYGASQLATEVNNLVNEMPGELQEVIRETTISCNDGYPNTSTYYDFKAKMFVISSFEFNEFAYLSTKSNLKNINKNNFSTSRVCMSGMSMYHARVRPEGTFDYPGFCSSDQLVLPIFCVGIEPELAVCGISRHYANDGRNHGLAKTNCVNNSHIYSCECETPFVLEEGYTYYSQAGKTKPGDFSQATAVYNSENPIPCSYVVQYGDALTDGLYEYRRGYICSSLDSNWQSTSATAQVGSWNVICLDKSRTEYPSPIGMIMDWKVALYCTYKDCVNLTTIPDLDPQIAEFEYAFQNCKNLKTYVGSNEPDGYFTNFVFNCQYPDGESIFAGCTSMIAAPKDCERLFSATRLFYNCTNLEIAPVIDTYMSGSAFSGCKKLRTYYDSTDPDYDFSNYPIASNSRYMYGLFEGTPIEIAPTIEHCQYLQSISYMFQDCTNLRSYKGSVDADYDFSNYVLPSSTGFSTYSCQMLFKNTNITYAPSIPECITDVSSMFSGCKYLKAAPTIHSKVTSVNFVFSNCTSLTGTVTINVSGLSCNYAFENVDMSNIVLTGTSTDLEKYAQSGKNPEQATIIPTT